MILGALVLSLTVAGLPADTSFAARLPQEGGVGAVAAGPRREAPRFGDLDAAGRPVAEVGRYAASSDLASKALLASVVPLATTGAASAARAAAADTPAVVRRPRAIEYPDAYYTRLQIHKIGSYVMLPLFGAEYVVGQRLMSATSTPPSWMLPTHRVVAGALAAVFTVNTVTGVWNLWDARHDPNGRVRRYVHALTMLVSDAGFVATGLTAHQARYTLAGAQRHRDIALASIGLSTASAIYMWLTR